MRSKKKSVFPRILLFVGIALIVFVLAFGLMYVIGQKKAVKENEEVLSFLEGILPERHTGMKENFQNNQMPAIAYGETDYIGILELPAFGTKLPVVKDWSTWKVLSVPCRFDGSVFDGSLIIGGMDEPGQFDFIAVADIGDQVTVTDLWGDVYRYTVKKVLHAKDAKAETLKDEAYDLTLFAHSKETKDYILLRCGME